MLFLSLFLLAMGLVASAKLEYNMYLTAWRNNVPSLQDVAHITHVTLAFMNSNKFNEQNPTDFPLFTSIDAIRQKFSPGTKVVVAIGGWGDTSGFSIGSKTEESRALWAKNVAKMLEVTGADGVDIDWEYPGGNGEDYKQTPNSAKAPEIPAFPLFLAAIRSALPPGALLSAAIPGKPGDMLAFTPTNVPSIAASLDYANVMTYDLMNRRDALTTHHTGIAGSKVALDTYAARGFPREKMYLGFAFYAKWFRTDPAGNCTKAEPIGCRAVLMEDPNSGADLGVSGAVAWAEGAPWNVQASFARAREGVVYDEVEGGSYFWDEGEDVFWSWDTEDAIARKEVLVRESEVGGVFAWGLGEDAYEYKHLRALNGVVAKVNGA